MEKREGGVRKGGNGEGHREREIRRGDRGKGRCKDWVEEKKGRREEAMEGW